MKSPITLPEFAGENKRRFKHHCSNCNELFHFNRLDVIESGSSVPCARAKEDENGLLGKTNDDLYVKITLNDIHFSLT